MTKTEAETLLRKHGSIRAAARSIGRHRSLIQRALHGKGAKAPEAKEPAGRSITEFRSLYDKDYIIPRKIKAAIKALGSGWEYEVQFARGAGIGLSDLGNYRDQFADYVVTLRESRRVWAGSVATAKSIRGML